MLERNNDNRSSGGSASRGLTQVSVSTMRNVYSHDVRILLLKYIAVAAADLTAVAVGVCALAAIVVSMTAGFTAPLAMTLNEAFDLIMAGCCLGTETLQAHVKVTELRIGKVISTQTRLLITPPQHLQSPQACVSSRIFRCR